VKNGRQSQLLERPAQIAGVAGQDHLAALQPHAQRLVPGRVAVGGQADDAPVAEQVVLAVDLDHVLSQVVVARLVAAALDQLRVAAGLPLPALDHDGRIGDLRVPAGVVEVQVRVDQVAEVAEVDLELLQTRRDLLARLEVNLEVLRHAAQVGHRLGQRLEVQTAVEEQLAPRMVDQVAGHGNPNRPLLALQGESQGHREPAAGHRVQSHRHLAPP
jgi:hypothetical protein